MGTAPLTVLKGGIDRLRTKGGARADSLYDLLNAHLTEKGTVKGRPGTLRTAEPDATTKGLVSFQGSFHVFSNAVVAVPSGYVLHVITSPDDATLEITSIRYAKPYMGFLYVVAEFEDGNTWHFWLRQSGTWQADHIYRNGDIVVPTVVNGIAYEAIRSDAPNPSWAPSVPRADGDKVEPTEYNDFYYTVVDTLGTSPRSGTEEPVWPTEDGAQVIEDVDGIGTSTATATDTPANQIPQDVQERYE